MIDILFDFTVQEEIEIEEIEREYEARIAEVAKILQSRADPIPDTDIYFENINERADPIEWEAATKTENTVKEAWVSSGSAEWKKARAQQSELIEKLNNDRRHFYLKAEKRAFKEMGNTLQDIFTDGRRQTDRLIETIYQDIKNKERECISFAARNVVSLGGGKWKLDYEATKEQIYGALNLYFNALKSDTTLFNDLNSYIVKSLSISPYVAKENAAGRGKIIQVIHEEDDPLSVAIVKSTKYSRTYITPIDKVSNMAFSNKLNAKLQAIAMERKGSKKTITTYASIDFDKLNGNITIRGKKELTLYDRAVHDAITTLYVKGENEYITHQMIYQTMTGNPNAILHAKQAETVSDSITKFLYSEVTIEAQEEADAYGYDKLNYSSSLISGERATATIKGIKIECLHLFRSPVLYEYASKKNQIESFDIKLLNSPINKTEEIIALQDYLLRRILAVKSNGKLPKTMLYETVYNQIGVKAASSGALRVKKAKIREQIKRILDYFKTENFIGDYMENSRKQEAYSVNINI